MRISLLMKYSFHQRSYPDRSLIFIMFSKTTSCHISFRNAHVFEDFRLCLGQVNTVEKNKNNGKMLFQWTKDKYDKNTKDQFLQDSPDRKGQRQRGNLIDHSILHLHWRNSHLHIHLIHLFPCSLQHCLPQWPSLELMYSLQFYSTVVNILYNYLQLGSAIFEWNLRNETYQYMEKGQPLVLLLWYLSML